MTSRGPQVRKAPEVRPTGAPSSLPEPIREFSEFAGFAYRFSRQTARAQGVATVEPPDERAARNVRIVRSIFSKWNLEILSLLYDLEETGFEELRRHLRTISARVLSQKLSFLQERGLVARAVVATTPVRVRYFLTERGLILARIGEPVILYLHSISRAPPSSPAVPNRSSPS